MIKLIPAFHPRVWGGTRLQQGTEPIGEAWVVHEENQIATGPHQGKTLLELVQEQGASLLGSKATDLQRFPLLIKLLDCQDWLSIQVHPNDEQAVALHGPGHQGKTEAWHVLEADENAQVIAGVKPGTSQEQLQALILAGQIRDCADQQVVRAGDTIFMPAGTLHALGPGLFIYEVQQTSDITYRVHDWDRPASAGRQLHLQESAQVTRADLAAQVKPCPDLHGTVSETVVKSGYFHTELLQLAGPLQQETTGETFHILTVTRGQVEVSSAGETLVLSPLDTVLVPAQATQYQLRPLQDEAHLLRSSLP